MARTDSNLTVEEMRERVAELDAEHPGQNFPSAVRDEWNDLNERIDELETRRARVAELAKNPANHDVAPIPGLRDPNTVRDGAMRTIERHVNESRLTSEAAGPRRRCPTGRRRPVRPRRPLHRGARLAGVHAGVRQAPAVR